MSESARISIAPADPRGHVPVWAWNCATHILASGYSDRPFDHEIPRILKAICDIDELGLHSRAVLYLRSGAGDELLLSGQFNVPWTSIDHAIAAPTEFLSLDLRAVAPTLHISLRTGETVAGIIVLYPDAHWQPSLERVEGLQHIADQLMIVLSALKPQSLLAGSASTHRAATAHLADGRDADQLLSNIIANFPGGLCVFDNDLTMLITNRRFYELLDLPAELFPPGSNFADVFRYNARRGEYGAGDVDEIVNSRLNHVRLFLEHSFDRETGSGLIIEARTAPLPGGGCILTYLDVTAKRRAEQALLKHKETLEELVAVRTEEIEHQARELQRMLDQERQINEMQRQFVSMTSHEFRTPLAIIDGAAQRLLRRKDPLTAEFAYEKATLIRGAVTRMVDLMESFLSAGRLENGKMQFKSQACALKDIVSRCGQRQQTIAKSHQIHLDLDDLPDIIHADIAAMEQVFTNLLSNAVKYAPNSPDIFVRGGVNDGFAWVSVRDQGVGVDAEDIPMLFQRYFRARTSTGIAGTGIGLNLVQQIIEHHGGKVAVSSRKGEGTTFTVQLPLDDMPARTASEWNENNDHDSMH